MLHQNTLHLTLSLVKKLNLKFKTTIKPKELYPNLLE